MTSHIHKTLLFLLLFASSAAAENHFVSRHFNGGVIHYTLRDEEFANAVTEAYPWCLKEVNQLLHRNYKHAVRIYLYRPGCGFEERGVSDVGVFAQAYAVCGGLFQDSIVFLMHRCCGGMSRMYSVLMHETVHLVVGEAKTRGGQGLPKWFEEGLADWLPQRKEGLSQEDRRKLRKKMKPWSELAGKFPEYDEQEMRFAYLQSKYILMYLVEKYGLKAIREIVGLIEGGAKFEEAFRNATGVTVAEAERGWREFVIKITADEVILQITGCLAVFGTGALVITATLIGIVRLRRRRRAIIEQFEEEESRRIPHGPPPVSDRS